jgi:hypothetical protein
MLGCEQYAFAVAVKDAQEASLVNKGIWFFVVPDGYDAFCTRFTSILDDSIPKSLTIDLAIAVFVDVRTQSVLL